MIKSVFLSSLLFPCSFLRFLWSIHGNHYSKSCEISTKIHGSIYGYYPGTCALGIGWERGWGWVGWGLKNSIPIGDGDKSPFPKTNLIGQWKMPINIHALHIHYLLTTDGVPNRKLLDYSSYETIGIATSVVFSSKWFNFDRFYGMRESPWGFPFLGLFENSSPGISPSPSPSPPPPGKSPPRSHPTADRRWLITIDSSVFADWSGFHQ